MTSAVDMTPQRGRTLLRSVLSCLIFVGLTACGDPQDGTPGSESASGAPASVQEVSPCALLTAKELRRVTGFTFEPGQDQVRSGVRATRACLFTAGVPGQSDAFVDVTVEISVWPGVADLSQYFAEVIDGMAEPVPGSLSAGDETYWGDGVFVRYRTVQLNLRVRGDHGWAPDGLKARTLRLAAKAVNRLD